MILVFLRGIPGQVSWAGRTGNKPPAEAAAQMAVSR